MIKKTLFYLFLISGSILLAGCSNDKEKIELLQDKIIEQNQKIIDLQQKTLSGEVSESNTSNVSKTTQTKKIQSASKEQITPSNDIFQRKQDCIKHKSDVIREYGSDKSITVFFSPYKNSCLAEIIYIGNQGKENSFYRVVEDILAGKMILGEGGDGTLMVNELGIENGSYSTLYKMLQ